MAHRKLIWRVRDKHPLPTPTSMNLLSVPRRMERRTVADTASLGAAQDLGGGGGNTGVANQTGTCAPPSKDCNEVTAMDATNSQVVFGTPPFRKRLEQLRSAPSMDMRVVAGLGSTGPPLFETTSVTVFFNNQTNTTDIVLADAGQRKNSTQVVNGTLHVFKLQCRSPTAKCFNAKLDPKDELAYPVNTAGMTLLAAYESNNSALGAGRRAIYSDFNTQQLHVIDLARNVSRPLKIIRDDGPPLDVVRSTRPCSWCFFAWSDHILPQRVLL